jgi:hypothetical protein
MDPSDDDHLNRSVTELGDPDALFQISRGRFLAKLLVGGSIVLVGLVANYFWWVEGPGRFDHFAIALLISLPITGGGLLWHMYRQRGLNILIYPTGLLRLRRGEIDSFPWKDVDRVQVKVQRAAAVEIIRAPDGMLIECWLPVEVPTFQLWKAGLTLAREDGVEAQFSAALTDYSRLAEEVQKRTFAVLWPPIWRRFLTGVPIAFGDLEVSLAGIHHAGKIIRWADVKEMTVLQGILRIKQGKKWFPMVLMPDVFAIPNPHILFALVREAQRIAVS